MLIRMMQIGLVVVLVIAAFTIVQSLVPEYDPAVSRPRRTPRTETNAEPEAAAAGEVDTAATRIPDAAGDLDDVRALLAAFDIAAERGDRVAALTYLERAYERHPDNRALQAAVEEYRRPPARPPPPAARPLPAPESRIPEEELRARARGGFTIRFQGPEQLDLAERALDILQDAHVDVRQILGVVPTTPVDVIIYSSGAYARALATTQWEVARFDGKVRVSRADLLAASGELRRVLYHEYMHAVLHDTPGVPAWFHEGLAQYIEPPTPPRRRDIVWRAVTAGEHLRLTDLKRSFLRFDDADTAGLAYAESLSLLDFMISERGESRLRGLVQRLCAGEGFDHLLAEIFAADQRRFEAEWIVWVKGGS